MQVNKREIYNKLIHKSLEQFYLEIVINIIKLKYYFT